MLGICVAQGTRFTIASKTFFPVGSNWCVDAGMHEGAPGSGLFEAVHVVQIRTSACAAQ
jgi:hypothetical protein